MSVWMLERESGGGSERGGGGGVLGVCLCLCDQEESLAGIDMSCRD